MSWIERDPLSAEAIAARLTTRRLGRPLHVHRLLASTSDRVRELALGGERPGLAVLAEEQGAGRGRHGRVWMSPPGAGVWMTVLLPPVVGSPPPGSGPGLVTLAAALAVRRAVQAVTGLAPGLKWPNDVMVGDAKLCGILGEMLGERGVALGIGVNVHDSPPDEALGGRRATHLDRELGHPVERNPIAASILNELEPVDDDLRAGRGAQVLAAWRESCNHLGQAVTVDLGTHMEHGIALSVNAEGGLVLARPDGSQVTVWSGTLHLGGPPPGAPGAPGASP